jgi:hypothetical protein
LPAAPKTGAEAYSDVELTRAKAFLVFAHAELEDYLEGACKAKAERALAAAEMGQITLTAISLVGHYGERIPVVRDVAKFTERHRGFVRDFPQPGIDITRAMLSRIKDALSSYFEQCRVNNGVKEANLLPMLLPLGISALIIEPTWLAEMNGFGFDRGAHAHRGLASVQQIADPFLTQARLDRLLNGPPGAAPPANSPSVHSLRSLDGLLAS